MCIREKKKRARQVEARVGTVQMIFQLADVRENVDNALAAAAAPWAHLEF